MPCLVAGTVIDLLATVDQEQVVMNDAKCDSSGRLWFGTYGRITDPDKVESGGGVAPGGAIYSYDRGQLHTSLWTCAAQRGGQLSTMQKICV